MPTLWEAERDKLMSKAGIALIILMLVAACLFLNLALPKGLSDSQVEQTKIAVVQGELSYARTITIQADYRLSTATADARTATAQINASTATAQRQATEVQQIVDRNSAVATADAAQATAQYLYGQATATAQAESLQQTSTAEETYRRQTAEAIRATETAGALRKTETAYDVQQTAQAQATSTERAWIITQTAQSAYVTQTANAYQVTATRQADIVAVERTAEAVKGESLALSLEREKMSNALNALAPWGIGIALVIVALFIAWRWSKVQQVGKVLVFNGNLAYDPNRNSVPWMRIMQDGKIDAPLLVPAQMQADTTRRDQAIDALRVLPAGSARPQVQSAFAQPKKAEDPQEPMIPLPEAANWERLLSWSFDRNKRLPLGLGAGERGIGVDPEETPHLMIAGTSGSGKSRCGILPISACALTAGFRVVTMNAAAGDFVALSSHPNFTELEGEGPVIADALEAAVSEMERRSRELRAMGVSTLSRANRPDMEPMMVVVDELVSLAWDSVSSVRDRIWRAIIKLTSKGRKLGMMLVVGTTDPTHRTLGREGLTVRDNCAVVTFRVRSGAVSQAVLGQYGAEELGKDQFLVRLINDLVRGVAFHPSDDEVKSFLSSRPVAGLPAPAWFGNTRSQPDDLADIDMRILQLNSDGKNIAQICREIYGAENAGGAMWNHVKRLVSENPTTLPTTDPTTQKTPVEAPQGVVGADNNQKDN
jgi:hypothetical protein